MPEGRTGPWPMLLRFERVYKIKPTPSKGKNGLPIFKTTHVITCSYVKATAREVRVGPADDLVAVRNRSGWQFDGETWDYFLVWTEEDL